MAGGKETPRQKMIGMMYLVLTALLALNVSKSILDAFVAIEENMQKVNVVQADRGNVFLSDVKSELSTTTGEDQAEKRAKLKYVAQKMQAIDKETSEIIGFIDDLKLEILKESGENVSSYHFRDQKSILWKKQDGITPMRMWLAAVEGMDKFDEPMRVLGVDSDIKNPKGKGMELWKRYNNFRSFIVNSTGTYQMPEAESGYRIETKPINDFVDNQDLAKKVNAMIENSEVNLREDKQVLIDLYMMLTKKEKNDVHDQSGIHWIGMTFDHSPVVAAIASLSSMQQEILAARALSLANYKGKVGVGNYSFNKIVGLAYGPSFANAGEDVQVKVMMAAFDTDNNPTISYGGNSFVGEGGQGIINVKASGNEMTLSGTVSIKNKSGVSKTEKWEHKVKIMKPAGAISLPEMNVLYRGHKNRVSAVASGFDQTNLSASAGTTLMRSGDEWIASPGAGRTASLTVSGVNSITKKTQQLLTQSFRVMQVPNPDLFWGSSGPGGPVAPNATQLFTKYGEGIPLEPNFKIISWQCKIPNAPGAPISGNGSNVSAALSMVKMLKPGMYVNFIALVEDGSGLRRKVESNYKM